MEPGKALEADVQAVFSFLLNLKDEGVVVSTNAMLRGKSGSDYRVDVYYEFVRAGVNHRVLIECKDRGRPVEREDLLAFHTKLLEVPNAIGVFIARHGFQKGFREFADHHGITYLRFDELPNLPQLMGMRLRSVGLPDATCLGEPFWCLMETRDGLVTGSLFGGAKDPAEPDRPVTPLFFSRQHAQTFLNDHALGERFAVRGLPQYVLRGILQLVYALHGKFHLAWHHDADGPVRWGGKALEPEQVAAQYFLGPLTFSESERMPHVHRRKKPPVL